MGVPHAIFGKSDTEAVTGALVQDPRNAPSSTGAVVYLNAGKDLEGWVTRARSAGAEVLVPITDIGPPGYIALIKDTEGNRVGFHAPR
jgi:predicted enzyme related to lactoylglutathione lyase